MYKFLFGPVPSRRLGMSLGVDLVPKKVCSLNCVYCEVGRTTLLTTERKEYILYDKVTSELEHYFANNPDPDYITFSGSGEPTLNTKIGEVLQFVKQIKKDVPVAVLTNGTLFYNKKVRHELMGANVVLPSLDAATETTFRKINRPATQLTVDKYIPGLIDFRNEFKGTIWLEVMIIPGYNDGMDNLNSIKDAILKIKPDKIQLNTLDRPGIVHGLRAARWDELQKIIELWGLDNVEIIAPIPERKDMTSYRKDIESTIVETISRRSCTLDDLHKILGIHHNEINKYLGVLEGEGKVKTIRADRGWFYAIDF
ncbi:MULTISPECIES: radical SAM protein [unclassified Saccharicrinis]|uniref:radical SAM protein n=1 Tax=unclassified Saccharicrinis TaxID=2646859 RepID=UPI003D33A577